MSSSLAPGPLPEEVFCSWAGLEASIVSSVLSPPGKPGPFWPLLPLLLGRGTLDTVFGLGPFSKPRPNLWKGWDLVEHVHIVLANCILFFKVGFRHLWHLCSRFGGSLDSTFSGHSLIMTCSHVWPALGS